MLIFGLKDDKIQNYYLSENNFKSFINSIIFQNKFDEIRKFSCNFISILSYLQINKYGEFFMYYLLENLEKSGQDYLEFYALLCQIFEITKRKECGGINFGQIFERVFNKLDNHQSRELSTNFFSDKTLVGYLQFI